jgi:2,3-dihydroxybiphenyl 1,2-dioxygenase
MANAAVTQLGYLGFEVKDLDAWRKVTTEVLGLVVASEGTDGSFSLRMDSYAQRFFVTPGDGNDLSVVGWQADGPAELAALSTKLEAAGITVTAGTAEEAAARNVAGLIKFTDPGGVPSEIFYGPEKAATPFESPVVTSGFIADDMGLGHAVLTARTQAESVEFYEKVLGFRLSDKIVCEIQGYKVDIAFMHANRRHHSIAFGDQQRKRIHHFMLEARELEDVGKCYDRAIRAGLRIVQTLGRHPNDRMLSFYAKTPSGFEFEFGWGGREIDDATWETTTYDRVSDWGHHPPQMLAPRPKPKAPQA